MLASGSRGNATYVSDGTTAILLDAGLSGVEIERRLASKGLTAADLDAIVVTHEHSDHIQAVGVLSRRHRLPVFLSRHTHAAVASQLGALHRHETFCCGRPFTVNTLMLRPFSISHDACDPAAFVIGNGPLRIGVATDLGVATALVKAHLTNLRLLIVEANHDPKMLHDGPYPWPLKQRIQGRTGHLSNEDARDLLAEVIHAGLQHVILAHLSEQNNTPEKALAAVAAVVPNGNTRVTVADPREGTPLVHLLPESIRPPEARAAGIGAEPAPAASQP